MTSTEADLRAELHRTGFASVRMPEAEAARPALFAEAVTLQERAERIVKDAYELWADDQEFRSPVRYGIAFDTDRLRALHTSPELRRTANELAARQMEPTYSGYLYYEDGDYIGLHTDLPACELTLLAAVGPNCPPLVVHRELAVLAPERLKDFAEAAGGAPDGGTALPIVPGSLVALFGGGLPHQTRPVATEGVAVVATLCFAGV